MSSFFLACLVGVLNFSGALLLWFVNQKFSFVWVIGEVSLIVSGVYLIVFAFFSRSSVTREANHLLLNSEQRIVAMQEKMEENQRLFQQQIELLNKVVEERSHYDAWQLMHSPIGILAFSLDGRVDNNFSTICLQLFGESFSNSSIDLVLYQEKEKQAYFREWLEVAKLGRLPAKDLAGLLDSSSQIPNYSNKKRALPHFELRYVFSPVFKNNMSQSIEKVVVFIMDVTKERKLEKELETVGLKLEMILQIARDKERYRKYLELCHNSILALEDIAEHFLENIIAQNINSAFRLVHTIRGNSAAFGVKALRDAGESMEGLLLDGRENRIAVGIDFQRKLQQMIPDLRNELNQHILETEKIFKELFDPQKKLGQTFQISQDNILTFEKLVRHIPEIELRDELLDMIRKLIFIPIKRFLIQYTEIIQQMALRQEKKIAPLVITGGELLVDKKSLEPFFSSFVHLINNCIDHGIESTAERLDKLKSEEATIRIRVQKGESGLLIAVEDDGQGIDPELLAKKALQKGMITKTHLLAMTLEDKYQLIFREGFSTTRRLTSTSGRGVGMSVVKQEVEKLNGTINVSSQIGKGTMFVISLPVEVY